ncbi:MAG: flagellar type III secretion system pore protein FliP [Actinomycetota bacterium]
MSTHRTSRWTIVLIVAAFGVATLVASPAGAQVVPSPDTPEIPQTPVPGEENGVDTFNPTDEDATISIDLGDVDGDGENKPGQSVVIILLLTLLAIAPALLMMLTSFTRIVIVLSLTRNAIGLTSIPPNQVVIGLSLFLSLFVMSPTLSELNEKALQPLLDGELSYGEAYDAAQDPLREFMLAQTRRGELNLFIKASGEEAPENREDVSMATLVPAFVLSELKTAFIIGFVVFVPFLIIDLVISSTLMSMGMFMLPPVLVSLPFKLLLFVMVDGWALVVKSLVTSFN